MKMPPSQGPARLSRLSPARLFSPRPKLMLPITTLRTQSTMNQAKDLSPKIRKFSKQEPISYQTVATSYYGSEMGRVRCDTLTLDKEQHVIAKVFIQNVSRGNALSIPLLDALTTTFRNLASQNDIKCVILAAAVTSNAFCTGMVSRPKRLSAWVLPLTANTFHRMYRN